MPRPSSKTAPGGDAPGSRPLTVFGFIGSVLDIGSTADRWNRWRPSVALCQHQDLLVRRFELFHDAKTKPLFDTVVQDIRFVSPETEVRGHVLELKNPWDFEEVYEALHGFARGYAFDPEREDYLVHITTGTHVAQICLFLLTETRHFPARLVQTAPPRRQQSSEEVAGSFHIIDLDLSRYDRIAQRFAVESREGQSFLKLGIATRNREFNQLIERIEHVAIRTRDPLLLTGPTGAGKSMLAGRIFDLKKSRRQVEGRFVELNCATLRGDAAMSALFGHARGAFTGALADRPGLLKAADGGVLFLDEIGELGPDEQAMLLRAIEEHKFFPLGSDREVSSDFQLIAGTNRNMQADVRAGRFREDLLARINVWSFELPGLKGRREDIGPNLEFELEKYSQRGGQRVAFSREAREAFLAFATSPAAAWTANFRDLNAALTRMATLAEGGRITEAIVAEEIVRLQSRWGQEEPPAKGEDLLESVLGPARASRLDRFDRVQLADVIEVCRQSRSLSDAGRKLFAVSREGKKSANDADRLRKYLARFGLRWESL